MEEKKTGVSRTLTLKDRNTLTVEGVRFVESFDAEGVTLNTQDGRVSVEGKDLRMEDLSGAEGTVRIVGTVSGIFYSEAGAGTKTFFGKLFR